MGHATSNANDVGGHCRLPRKYIQPVQSKNKKKEERRKVTSATIYERIHT